MKKGLLVIALLVCASFGYAQTKKAITHEDLWLMKRVGAPIVSPNGKWVVFNVTDAAYDEKDQSSDLWIVPSDASAKPRKLTSSKGGESGYVWSPDGSKIAFTAKRDGDEVAQIYIINIKEGGEAQRFTSLTTGASSPNWSPNGKQLLFTSKVYAEALTDSANKKIADDKKKLKYKARVYTSFPVRNWDQWVDDKQTHLFIQSTDTDAKAKDLLAGTQFIKSPGFNFGGSAQWTPDGNAIVFAATTNQNGAAYEDVYSNFYKINTTGGEPTQLTSSKDEVSNPTFSPDGKYLYCIYTNSITTSGKVYNLPRIARYNWPSMQGFTSITSNLDNPVSSFEVSGDGKTIYLNAEDQGQQKLFTVSSNGGKVNLLINNPRGCYNGLSISTEGKETVVVASYENASMPAEIVKVPLKGTAHQQLSFFNTAKVANLDMPEIKTVWITSSRGKKIHSLMILPAGFDAAKKYPLFVVIHGGPASAWMDNFGYRWNYHLLAQPGYVLLLTNYTGSTGFGEKFGQEIDGDPFKGPGDEINEAAAYAVQNYSFIDGTRQAAGGASYGGHLANWLEATTTHYKCLISHAGLVNSESQWGTSDAIYHREIGAGGPPWSQNEVWKSQNPIRYAAHFKTPILVTVGEQDFRVPLNNSLENWSVLQRMKVPSKLIVFPEENHWILKGENSKFFYQQVHEWLKTYLQ
ncbi:S9 family peptidase [Solitalea sp. MAHUQ-68]|uniref:S9 family peptidase n=1 Tax=Solitalea agri TaxID=2953739 RepID=A0A9X2F7Q9_9SPHI|nr:S9 family peptidase [Solitalea agri]MCO4292213.1 S9 family peptidase [Solitalea agri]